VNYKYPPSGLGGLGVLAVQFYRGNGFLGLRWGPWHAAFCRPVPAHLGPAAWGSDRVGGCRLWRLGPLAVTDWG
jgi:hypothetical protein